MGLCGVSSPGRTRRFARGPLDLSWVSLGYDVNLLVLSHTTQHWSGHIWSIVISFGPCYTKQMGTGWREESRGSKAVHSPMCTVRGFTIRQIHRNLRKGHRPLEQHELQLTSLLVVKS